NKVKRSQFQDKEDLTIKITIACNTVPHEHLKALLQYSVSVFEKCLKSDSN
ncbi:uncharacterized protein B0P05DRAFT_469333, partial [Gilbertella persicaria]|uniref:uncharacterized protein n=1 Tax=Gilbertella persicaria TaxID=101096 RepID=UPI00222007A5